MSRTLARAGIMQVLYDMASNEDYSLDKVDLFLSMDHDPEENEGLSTFLKNEKRKSMEVKEGRFLDSERAYIRQQVPLIVDHLEEVDQVIKRNLKNWSLGRLALVDLSIIRIACYEMMFEEDIPLPVSINEAVNLAKCYGSEDSSRFINGILSSIVKDLEKDHETPED
ncbi:MAG: transcription antitermination factor NusB [Tissierellia bacterium]|nr:transcription antitermination factor NusB [Tissierellia bacterium]